ncbi:MAG: hypothetical protein QNJ44_02575 [Rhodobacter sp.]|nr:hypothetical protein [Rhodobacter sp.]
MTLRRWLVLVGVVAWVTLAIAWAAGFGGHWLPYGLAALTLLLAGEGVIWLNQRVRSWRTGRNGDA